VREISPLRFVWHLLPELVRFPIWRMIRYTSLRLRARSISKVYTSAFEQVDPKLGDILQDMTRGEPQSVELAPHRHGSIELKERVACVAELCAERWPGDFVEIGCYVGETTKKLAKVAEQYRRRLIAVDPWMAGTQNCEGWEYDAFLRNIEPYMDSVDIVRASSLDRKTIALIKARTLSFAFVDGLHTYSACLSDIQTTSHCEGIIGVDDILWDNEIMLAFRRGAHLTHRTAIHHSLCREGYLLPRC
jgi:predicted O-methyltransferase YrrM